jgi:succinoglycan biosynthesis protein ExoA
LQTELPFITVAIPTLNEADHIEATLLTLSRGYPTDRMEILVADGGSTDQTRTKVQDLAQSSPWIKLVDNPGRIQSRAVNLVSTLADPRSVYLVRADAHAGYPSDFLEKLVRRLDSGDLASVVTVMDTIGQSCFQKAVAAASNSVIGAGGSAHRQGNYSGPIDHGHHAGFSLKWFRSLNGYDPDFAWNEDAEYDTRVRQAGGVVFLDGSIRLEYYPRATSMSLARQYFRYGRGRAMTAMKHKSRLRLRQMAPVVVLLANGACLAGSVIAPVLLIGPLGYAGLLGLASMDLFRRSKDRCTLGAGWAAAIMHHAWAAGFLHQVLLKKPSTP